MEKIFCTLWGTEPDKLLTSAAEKLADAGATNIRINVRDDAVAAGAGLIQSRGGPLPSAAMQFWVPSSNAIFRGPLDAIINEYCDHFHSWLVVESRIIPNGKYPPVAGERTDGFAQLAFLTLPPGMDWQAWRAVWRDYHTQVAIDTQSNFEYFQNLVVEPLTDGAPPYVAIVEECFPIKALTDPLVFFDAVGDQGKFDRNLAAMMESCGRFIAPGGIDVFPTSQYDFA